MTVSESLLKATTIAAEDCNPALKHRSLAACKEFASGKLGRCARHRAHSQPDLDGIKFVEHVELGDSQQSKPLTSTAYGRITPSKTNRNDGGRRWWPNSCPVTEVIVDGCLRVRWKGHLPPTRVL